LKAKDFLSKIGVMGDYKLGFMLLRLGEVASSQMKLSQIVLPYMKSLSSESEETVILTALTGWEAICLERVESQKLIKLSLERGVSFPLYAGASSKILLAYQDNSYIDSFLKKVPLVRFTRNTITNPVRLRRELKTIRRQGYSLSDQEADPGASAIGAPIFDHKGKIVAGLSIAGPRDRINEKNKVRLIRLLKETVAKISQDLGYTQSDK
jgi:DNA-binding IclR family transcriptional regulator